MFAHRSRRWANICPALGQRVVFAGIVPADDRWSTIKLSVFGKVMFLLLYYEAFIRVK